PAWFRGVLVLVWAARSGTPWRAIGFVRPRSWVGTISAGVICGVVLKLFMKSVVMPLFGADAINHPYHYLVHNRAALPAILYAVTRQIWLPMITHAVFELMAVAIIYWDLESAVAHWLFK